jgi:hypothetical protein
VDRVDEYRRVHRVQRPAGPFVHLRGDSLGNPRYRFFRHRRSISIGEMSRNLPTLSRTTTARSRRYHPVDAAAFSRSGVRTRPHGREKPRSPPNQQHRHPGFRPSASTVCGPNGAAPRIRPVPASITAFQSPSVSRVVRARGISATGSVATSTSCPAALACLSVNPTRPSSGVVNTM